MHPAGHGPPVLGAEVVGLLTVLLAHRHKAGNGSPGPGIEIITVGAEGPQARLPYALGIEIILFPADLRGACHGGECIGIEVIGLLADGVEAGLRFVFAAQVIKLPVHLLKPGHGPAAAVEAVIQAVYDAKLVAYHGASALEEVGALVNGLEAGLGGHNALGGAVVEGTVFLVEARIHDAGVAEMIIVTADPADPADSGHGLRIEVIGLLADGLKAALRLSAGAEVVGAVRERLQACPHNAFGSEGIKIASDGLLSGQGPAGKGIKVICLSRYLLEAGLQDIFLVHVIDSAVYGLEAGTGHAEAFCVEQTHFAAGIEDAVLRPGPVFGKVIIFARDLLPSCHRQAVFKVIGPAGDHGEAVLSGKCRAVRVKIIGYAGDHSRAVRQRGPVFVEVVADAVRHLPALLHAAVAAEEVPAAVDDLQARKGSAVFSAVKGPAVRADPAGLHDAVPVHAVEGAVCRYKAGLHDAAVVKAIGPAVNVLQAPADFAVPSAVKRSGRG